jgi:glycosyltransferase involved in cell wall biosynthesis
MVRVYKHIRRKDSAELRAITYEFLWRRLFWTRRRRIGAWEAETHQHHPQFPGDGFQPFSSHGASGRRLKLSVCMAAYNGERYVEDQLRSILHQLHAQDEVIVVDDASKDRTRDIIRSFNDDRIRLVEHPRNCGVVATFEDAIRNATGDILFLADDDDIWAPNKVERIVEMFLKHPEAQIVASRISIIDEQGLPSLDMCYNNRKVFCSSFWKNILRNHFQGSAMAFRSSLLNAVLPFPKHVGFLHDQWIGTRNAISGGPAVFIEEPLLFYRRHSQNFSKKMHRSQQVKVRLQLLWAHISRYLANGRNW